MSNSTHLYVVARGSLKQTENDYKTYQSVLV